MDEKNDILSIFHNIDNLLEVYENPNWFKLASISEVEILFKCAFSLETVFKDLSTKGLLQLFKKKLEEWWIYRGAPYEYGVNFFECICDKILHNLIVNTKHSLVAENAVDWYLRHCGVERLVNVTNDLLAFGDSYRMLANLTQGNDLIEYIVKGQLLLSFLVKDLNLGRRECVVSYIRNIENNSVSTFLCLLSLPTSNPELSRVQEIVLDTVLGKLNDHDIFCRVADVDKPLLINVIKQYPSFFEALLFKGIQVGKLFNYDLENGVCNWINEEVDISYEKYVLFFRCLISCGDQVKSNLFSLIQELMLEPNGSFWESVAKDTYFLFLRTHLSLLSSNLLQKSLKYLLKLQPLLPTMESELILSKQQEIFS